MRQYQGGVQAGPRRKGARQLLRRQRSREEQVTIGRNRILALRLSNASAISSPIFGSPEKPFVAPSLPGLYVSFVSMDAYNRDLPPPDRRQLHFYKAVCPLPSARAASNLHARAHPYASDREGLFFNVRHLELGDRCRKLASLGRTVVLHVGPEELAPRDDGPGGGGQEEWFCREAWTDRAADGRTVLHGRIYDEGGRHFASVMQDGLLKVEFEGEEGMRRYEEV